MASRIEHSNGIGREAKKRFLASGSTEWRGVVRVFYHCAYVHSYLLAQFRFVLTLVGTILVVNACPCSVRDRHSAVARPG